jgi:hypothetical protein
MKPEDMTCATCRFKFEHDDIVGLRCAKNAPIGYAEEIIHQIQPVYRGVIVAKYFHCAEGEWSEDVVIKLGDVDHKRRDFYRYGDISCFRMIYLENGTGE